MIKLQSVINALGGDTEAFYILQCILAHFFHPFFTQFLARFTRQKHTKKNGAFRRVFLNVLAPIFKCYRPNFGGEVSKISDMFRPDILLFFLSIGHASFIVISLLQVNTYWINGLGITIMQ